MVTERDVYNALTGAGFSMTQAAGIMGNIQNESGFNPEAVGDGGTSFGLVQWHVPGYPFAPGLVTGNVSHDLANQIKYIVQAAHGVNMGGTASDIAGNWAANFERCVGCQPGGAQYISRQQNAARIFAQAQSGNWPSGGGVGGGGGGGGGGGTTTTSFPGTSASGFEQQLGTIWGVSVPFFESTLKDVTGIITATEDIGRAIAGLANAFAWIEQRIAWWLVPSHWIRIISFLLGVPLTGFGIWNLTRTGKDYSVNVPVVGSVPASGGNLAPAIGIAEITAGSILLFIAFHNLPATVVDLPSLLTYVQSNVAKPGKGGGIPPGGIA